MREGSISGLIICICLSPIFLATAAPDFTPGAQKFQQEVATRFGAAEGLPQGRVQLIDCASRGVTRAFVSGKWHNFHDGKWSADATLAPTSESNFALPDAQGQRVEVAAPWREVRQVSRLGDQIFVASSNQLVSVMNGKTEKLPWPANRLINQVAVAPSGGLHVASSEGLFHQSGSDWERLNIPDSTGRAWAVKDVLGVAFDTKGKLWFAVKAGVGVQTESGWKFYEGKDGLPWNDFTGLAAGPAGEMWFGTHLGAIRFDGKVWHYRQGLCWLPDDDVGQIAIDSAGTAWFATAAGVGRIERRTMTLAEKAEFYEQEIERYIKRTPFGYVAEAGLRTAADKSSANPHDSDNDGLWTSMYGAGECFAYAATKDPKAKERAKKAFEALRFLQKVTQGGAPAPPKGYVARTIRPMDWPDPNVGRLKGDQEDQKHDRLWKAYEPRWPKSADGKWYWKSDTSSDELDGHYFFYPLYYDLCADTDAERERVREVVRDLTDHLISHDYLLIDHDGKPTRWGVFGPQFLNRSPNWIAERGLNSLSMLSYLSVAAHVTGDAKYTKACQSLIEEHGYAHNAMYPKVQHGPGSGNQSDDEMAFMDYYSLLRFSQNEDLKRMIRGSFFGYWVNEAPEMNPFFNFAYAAHSLEAKGQNAFRSFSLKPWPGWHEDSMAALYGLPLDRLSWGHKNSHRLDIVGLEPVRSSDLDDLDHRSRGHRVNGKVIPVENRHFNHWNTDPWRLDYGGNGGELASGTVFLLPYYMGLYHGFIERL
jgi:hypothetical protein